MKIIIADIHEDWQKEYFTKELSEHELVFIEDSVTLENISEHTDAEVLSVFITSKVNAEVINALPSLQLISTRSTGFDHVDLETASGKNITVCNVPFYGENTVAEHAMALLLSLARRLPESFRRVEDGKFTYEGLRGWDLKGKRLGLVGGGHIGLHIARMAVGFEMDVVVFDLKPLPEKAEEIGFSYVDELNELFRTSDVISLHLPLNEHTKHIISVDQFNMMKDGVFIINTARGGLIDTNALIESIQSGKVAGAGLDVLEEEHNLMEEMELLSKNNADKELLETLLQDHILMEMDNVIVTPHNAFNSNEALQRIIDTTIDNIKGQRTDGEQHLVEVKK